MPSLRNSNSSFWRWIDTTEFKNITAKEINFVYGSELSPCKTKKCRVNCGNPFCLRGICKRKRKALVDDDTAGTTYQKYAGMKNLGATCYISSIMQVLFHIPAFRNAVYEWEPQEHIPGTEMSTLELMMKELQILFLKLQYSDKTHIDPTDFISSLNIEPSIQQDVQEFHQLFLNFLWDSTDSPSNKKIQASIKSDFEGVFQYRIVCKVCGYESQQNSNFYTLAINIQSSKTVDLQHALIELTNVEEMSGANEYYCINCSALREAQRKTEFLKLPNILFLHVMRFVYDRKKNDKKKVMNVLKYSDDLDLSCFLVGENSSNSLYHLKSAVIHNGRSAHSGHYTAEIKDSTSGNWLFFNDEVVEDRSVSLKSHCCQDELSLKTYSSQNVYMLVYVRESFPLGVPLTQDKLKPDVKNKVIALCGTEKGNNSKDPCLVFTDWLNPEVLQAEKEWEVVPLLWLKKFIESEGQSSESIDNSKFVCNHGRLAINCLKGYRYINLKAANYLFSKFKGGPRLNYKSLCRVCVEQEFLVLKTKKTCNSPSSGECKYFVGLKSLNNWKSYLAIPQKSDVLTNGKAAENGTGGAGENTLFNEEISCRHGKLCLSDNKKLVSADVWAGLSYYFPGCPVFKETDVPCDICQVEEADKVSKDKENLENEKEVLASFTGNMLFPTEGTFFCLPTDPFVNQWKLYTRARSAGKNKPVSMKMDSIICNHGLFSYDPEDADDFSKLTFVTETEWILLCSLYENNELSVMVNFEDGAMVDCHPEVCLPCVQTRKEYEKSIFFKEKIFIRRITSCSNFDHDYLDVPDSCGYHNIVPDDDEFMNMLIKDLEDVDNGNIRKSARKRKRRGDIEIKVSHDDTLKVLRDKIQAYCKVHPLCQRLTLLDTGALLTADNSTLRDLKVRPDSIILLQTSFDESELYLSNAFSRDRRPEVGFEGSNLLGGAKRSRPFASKEGI